MQKAVLIDLKVKSVLKMQEASSAKKLQRVLVRLKSVRLGRKRVHPLPGRTGGGVEHHSHSPHGVQVLEVHMW